MLAHLKKVIWKIFSKLSEEYWGIFQLCFLQSLGQQCIGANDFLFCNSGAKCAAYYVTGSMAQATITASPHIVANVLYPPLCLAAQGRLMCLGHGHNLVRQICSLLRHRLFDQLNVVDIWGKLYFQGPTFVFQNIEQVVSYLVLSSFSISIYWGVLY